MVMHFRIEWFFGGPLVCVTRRFIEVTIQRSISRSLIKMQIFHVHARLWGIE
jgi:hypothetical protein